MDYGVAVLAQEGVVGGAVPARAPAETAVAGASRLAADRVSRFLLRKSRHGDLERERKKGVF